MTAGDVLPPVAVEATDAAGVAVIESVAARRRAELARLNLAGRTARQRCDTAEADLAAVTDVDADGIPADLLAVVDAMLEKAIGASELALASAEREASFIVDRAMAAAVDIVRRAGLDPAVVLSERAPAPIVREVAPPPTAADLWRTTQRSTAARPVAPVAAPTAPAVKDHPSASSARPVAAPPAPAPPVAPGPGASTPFVPVVVANHEVADRTPAPAQVPPASPAATMLLDEPTALAGADERADAFDTFWQEVPGERRVRDRILRRSPKESA